MNEDVSALASATSPTELWDQESAAHAVESSDAEVADESDLIDLDRAAMDGGFRSSGLVALGQRILGANRSLGSGAGSFFTAVACSIFVFLLLNWPQPDGLSSLFKPLLFTDTTPSGGDMGAHVWGPAYLRDNLLPQLRLSGWTPDWYAGFPAYHFYMVVPSLAIVALNLGLPWWIGVPLAAGVLYGAFYRTSTMPKYRRAIQVAAVAVAVLLVGMPYGVAFKVISVSGLVLFPISAWAMGRLARCAEPIPGFLALAAFVFLFDTNFSIYGGNIASTLAGEFAFSISLCLVLVTLGLVIRALDDRIWRTRAAVAVALVPLCHLLPTFFLIPAILLAVLLHESVSRRWYVAVVAAIAVPFGLAEPIGRVSAWLTNKPVDQVDVNLAVTVLAGLGAVVAALVALGSDGAVQKRAGWLFTFGPVAVMLSAFWLVPFYLQRPYFNDMGWERLEEVGPPLLTVPIKVALPVAAIGLALAYALKERIGLIFAGTGLIFLLCVVYLPEGKLWNARLLPFYYLSVYMVAAVGLGIVVRLLASAQARDFIKPKAATLNAATACALVAVLFAVSMPLRIVPGGNLADDGTYNVLFFKSTARSFIPSWVNWNYSGYEEKPAYAEYSGIVRTMDEVGQTEGCGRAMWEYEKGLERYGTPMALMLLPFWTDGCIGSMEGLYFESSGTTPFHFLNQSTMSESPSRAQRDLPYKNFDLETGVDQLQVMGVRYYLAQTDAAIAAANEHPDLTMITEAQPFVVFEVAGSELVEGLDSNPVVVSGPSEEQLAGRKAIPTRFDIGWESQAVKFYNDPETFLAFPAEDGPETWERFQVLEPSDGAAVTPATVSNIEMGSSEISFDVDEVGTPVLVKVSYFPNWKAKGADGPWRVGPNLMVVVPTSENVSMSYGYTFADIAGILLTLGGIAGLGYFSIVGRRQRELSAASAGKATVPYDDGGLVSRPSGADSPTQESTADDADRELVEAASGLEQSTAPAVAERQRSAKEVQSALEEWSSSSAESGVGTAVESDNLSDADGEETGADFEPETNGLPPRSEDLSEVAEASSENN